MALSKHMQRTTQPARPVSMPPMPELVNWTEEQINQYLREQFPERPVVSDPMRDKLPDDSLIWLCLLTESLHDMELHHDLMNIRKYGTRIVKQGEQWRLQPIIDPLGRVGWANQNEYMEAVNECLKPKATQLTGLLERAGRLKRAWEKMDERSGSSE